MISFLRPIRQMASAAIVTAVVAAVWIAPAGASESAVSTTLVTDGAISLAAGAVPAQPPAATANDGATRNNVAIKSDGAIKPAASNNVSGATVSGTTLSGATVEKQTLNANAAMPVTARRRVPASQQYERRIAPTRTSLSCSGVWCGNNFLLMLGIAY